MTDAEVALILGTVSNRLTAIEWMLTRVESETPPGRTQELVAHHSVKIRAARDAFNHEIEVLDPAGL
jgi:hypothetical protein